MKKDDLTSLRAQLIKQSQVTPRPFTESIQAHPNPPSAPFVHLDFGRVIQHEVLHAAVIFDFFGIYKKSVEDEFFPSVILVFEDSPRRKGFTSISWYFSELASASNYYMDNAAIVASLIAPSVFQADLPDYLFAGDLETAQYFYTDTTILEATQLLKKRRKKIRRLIRSNDLIRLVYPQAHRSLLKERYAVIMLSQAVEDTKINIYNMSVFFIEYAKLQQKKPIINQFLKKIKKDRVGFADELAEDRDKTREFVEQPQQAAEAEEVQEAQEEAQEETPEAETITPFEKLFEDL